MTPKESYNAAQRWVYVLIAVVIGGLALAQKFYELLTRYPVEALGLLAICFFAFSFYVIAKGRK